MKQKKQSKEAGWALWLLLAVVLINVVWAVAMPVLLRQGADQKTIANMLLIQKNYLVPAGRAVLVFLLVWKFILKKK